MKPFNTFAELIIDPKPSQIIDSIDSIDSKLSNLLISANYFFQKKIINPKNISLFIKLS